MVTISNGAATKLADFTALSSQLAMVTPSSTDSSAYTVVNTAAQACPTVDSEWLAASNLPPIANSDTCTCMLKSLSCVAKTGISGSATEELFNYICGTDNSACVGIAKNATTGTYGAYSMCNSYQQLSFAMNAYLLDNKKASCDFGGNATSQAASTASSCSSVLSAAGTAGTGSVTAVPTGAGVSSTGTGSSSAQSSSKSSAAGAMTVPQFDIGLLQLSMYVVAAVMAGAGMVIL